MPRVLLILCLLAVATAATANSGATIAGEPAEGGLKRSKSTSVTSPDHDAAATVPAPSLPARSSAPRTVAPRWHSLLPGMIR